MSRLRVVLIAMTLLIGISILGIARIQRAQKDEKKEDATPIKKGLFTQIQKEHSKLFEDKRIGRKLITELPGEDIVVTVGGDYVSGDSRLSLNDAIQKFVCESDAIILGSVISKNSQLTTDSKFIFTDYAVRPESVLKEDAVDSILRRATVTVTGPGGKVLLDGRIITVDDRSTKRLIVGDEYLLFLNRISKTGAYAVGPGSGLLSDGKSKLKNLSDRPGELPGGAEGPYIIELVKSHVSIPCVANP